MALRESLLPAVDAIRAIPGALGLRRFRVFTRVTVWSGDRPGLGTPTVTTTEVLVGGYPPKVVEQRSADVVAGGADNTTFAVGPITPEFTGGGKTPESLDPDATAFATESAYVVMGPGLPATGVVCQKIDGGTTKPFRYTLTLKSTGREG